jgi:hypothetical protein
VLDDLEAPKNNPSEAGNIDVVLQENIKLF